MSLLLTGVGNASSSFSPKALNPPLWLDASAPGSLYQDSAFTTPATAAGDPVGGQKDQSTNGRNATQATASKRPTLNLAAINGRNAILPDAVDDYLGLASPLSLTGAFTAWAVGTRAAGGSWIPLGSVAGTSVVTVYSNNNLYVGNAANQTVQATYTGSTGAILLRVRRNVAGVVYVRASGMPEFSLGSLAGTVLFDAVFARPGLSQYTGGVTRYAETIVTASDPVTDSPSQAAANESYLTSKWGVSF